MSEPAGQSDGNVAAGRTARAIVVVPVPPGQEARAPVQPTARSSTASRIHSPADRLAEAIGLARAIDLDVVNAAIVQLQRYRPSTLLGKGRVEELTAEVAANDVELVIVDHALSPGQQRNLEKALNAKVLDRTGLILEIFGSRAQTREGVLQVELAHLTYQRSRLVRSWTHLERQRGGAGFLGGPGESQLELDRRMIEARIEKIKQELAGVVRTRELHRAGRRRVPYPVVALVGYTNAGKSTLFNRLSGAGVLAQDQVFATLDPTMREIRLPSRRRIILSDTVGFISDLPTMLVAAFRATLEEVLTADLILHVRDISHAETAAQRADVEAVLTELGLEVGPNATNLLEVWNKVDLLAPDEIDLVRHRMQREEHTPVLISAATGQGMQQLLEAIDQHLGRTEEVVTLQLPPTAGALMHWIYENTDVIERETAEGGALILRLRLGGDKRARLEARLKNAGLDPAALFVELEPQPLRSLDLASSQSKSISSRDD